MKRATLPELVDQRWQAWGYANRRQAMRSVKRGLERNLFVPHLMKRFRPPPRWLREKCDALTRAGVRCRNPAGSNGRCHCHRFRELRSLHSRLICL